MSDLPMLPPSGPVLNKKGSSSSSTHSQATTREASSSRAASGVVSDEKISPSPIRSSSPRAQRPPSTATKSKEKKRDHIKKALDNVKVIIFNMLAEALNIHIIVNRIVS